MAATFDPLPNIQPEIENAAQSGELVVFVGAGISRLINCPSWEGFADRVLDQLAPEGIDYYELAQIKNIADPKKRLSIAKLVAREKRIKIDYARIFDVSLSSPNIYEYLNSFNSSFVTTNYEKYILPLSRKKDPEKDWRFYRREHLLGVNLDHNGNVIHIHGCVDEPESMIITTRDYLEHYSSQEVQQFLQYLFEKKTVLFLGYGLEEIEVLEYIFRRGGASPPESQRIRRFILQGFFQAEWALFEKLRSYYRESFATELIGFPKDYRDYAQQMEIIKIWSSKLKFEHMALADEVLALEEEIRG